MDTWTRYADMCAIYCSDYYREIANFHKTVLLHEWIRRKFPKVPRQCIESLCNPFYYYARGGNWNSTYISYDSFKRSWGAKAQEQNYLHYWCNRLTSSCIWHQTFAYHIGQSKHVFLCESKSEVDGILDRQIVKMDQSALEYVEADGTDDDSEHEHAPSDP